MREFLIRHIWPIVFGFVFSFFFKFVVEGWLEKQTAYFETPPLWIDYFYNDQLQKAMLIVKNINEKQSLEDIILHLKFMEVVYIDSADVYFNNLKISLSPVNYKTSNNQDYYLHITQRLDPDDVFHFNAKLQGTNKLSQTASHPEIIVRGEGLSLAYSDQLQTLKQYLKYFKLFVWSIFGLIICISVLISFVLSYKELAHIYLLASLPSKLRHWVENSKSIEKDHRQKLKQTGKKIIAGHLKDKENK